MAALRAVSAEHNVGLDVLWSWSTLRLQQALAWPDGVMKRVDAYRCSCGPAPNLEVPDEVLLPLDAEWPISLDRLEKPPSSLYRRGDDRLLPLLAEQRSVAVVGTRSASQHGLAMAEAMGAALAREGWPVLSGLADGVDAAAHRGCLSAGGVPVAVIGTPLDRVYPRHHQELQRSVANQGLLLSELSPAQRVQPGNFAARNRLLVAMARALVVVECPERSGALISAQLAVDLQCPVWVIPGDAARWSARGSNRLLQDQAAVLLSPDDLIAHLGPGPCKSQSGGASSHDLIEALGSGATLDALHKALGRPLSALSAELLMLELSGQAVCESGLNWRPSRR